MPIETVWDDVLAKLQDSKIRVETEDQLWVAIESTFHELCEDEYVTRLIAQIPTKLKKIVELKAALAIWFQE